MREIRKMLAREKGVTLIAVVLLILAIGIIAFIAGAVAVKLQEIAKERNTVKRMIVIRDALKAYYRGHQELPAPSSVLQVGGEDRGVPVAALDLEQKFALAANGQFFYYDENDNTNITDVTVDGKAVAAVLIGGGPNQAIDSDGNPSDYPDPAWGDDVGVAVNVQSEAIEIANEELRVLAKKACARKCGLAGWPTPGTTGIISEIVPEFSLGDTYNSDPWLNPYEWDIANKQAFSFGPDESESTADDIFAKAAGLSPCCPECGVASYWKLDETSGITASDSADGNPGTVFGGATWTSSGKVGGALTFDGSDDYVRTGVTGLKFTLPTEGTISLWVNADPTLSGPGIIFDGFDTSTFTLLMIFADPTPPGIVHAFVGDFSGPAEVALPMSFGVWHHIVLTWRGTNVTLYLDGSTGSVSDSYTSFTSIGDFLYLGRLIPDLLPPDPFFFKGSMDEVAVFTTWLNAAEVQDLFDRGNPTNPPYATPTPVCP